MSEKIPMTKNTVRAALNKHAETVTMWLGYAGKGGPHQGLDKMRKADELIKAALETLESGQLAAALLMLGNVQGILYALGLNTWEMIARDTER